MVHVDFAFGKKGLTLGLPDGFEYRVLEPRIARPLDAPMEAIERAVAPLGVLARGKKSAALSVCDITRPVPNRMTLPPLLAQLEKAGIGREAVTILIATGLHRPATNAEICEIVGGEVAGDRS